MKSISLSKLAKKLQAEIKGDGNCQISGLGTLQAAKFGQIAFLENKKYRQYLETTKASAVILSEADAKNFDGNALIVANPYLTYAMIARVFEHLPKTVAGIHPSAVVGDNCQIDASASIGPNAVLDDNVTIGADTIIGPNVSIGEGCVIGKQARLWANVTLYYRVVVGDRVILHSGAVIGADGFGFAPHEGRWHKVSQLGGVVLGDDVEIGANTTIDRGAIDNTIIENGAKLDNQIQIGHNARIGENTIIAGCTGIAGSTTIGKNCMIGGGAGIAGHIEIADQVIITAQGSVSNSLKEKGVYSSGVNVTDYRRWRKNSVRFQHLDEMARRLNKIEKQLTENSEEKK